MLHEFLDRLTEIFCELDDLAQELAAASRGRELPGRKAGRGGRKPTMHPSEVATILLLFQVSAYRDVKRFYQEYVCEHLADAFPGLVRYARFVELEKSVDDRNRDVMARLTERVFGKLVGDKGYIDASLFWELYDADIELVMSIRKNMKNKLSLLENRYAYRARGLVESVNHVLKDVLHAQHTRHRSPLNFLANLMAALCAYQLRDRGRLGPGARPRSRFRLRGPAGQFPNWRRG